MTSMFIHIVLISLLYGFVSGGHNGPINWESQQNHFGADALLTVQQMNVTLEGVLSDSYWWEVEKTADDAFYKLQANRIFLANESANNDALHSCYRYLLYDKGQNTFVKTNTFCSPLLVLTGYKKCSTSALYALLEQYPGTIKDSFTKENCAFTGTRSLIEYFDSLPRSVESGQIIINGCIDPFSNMKIRALLKIPTTFYIGITRNYADWLWSAYNYWCDGPYDKRCNSQNHWVIPGIHARSPEIFEEMVNIFTAGRDTRSPSVMKYCCDTGEHIYANFAKYHWTNGVPVEDTIFVASEELETHPERVWYRIAQAVGLNLIHAHINNKEFQGVRYNVNSAKGAGFQVNVSQYQPGLYEASEYRPMLNKTRLTLNNCWHNDCIFAALITGYNYSVCAALDPVPWLNWDPTLKKYVQYFEGGTHVVPFLKRMQEQKKLNVISSNSGASNAPRLLRGR